MSKLTAAQIIGLGEYLNPDFDPTSLTVSQLLGVLGFHNIRYPSPYTKPKLVQLFNDEIRPKSSKFKKERLKHEASLASDDGITDGLTGKPIRGQKPIARRSSRRLSSLTTEEDSLPARPDPPKRRRSSAQPTLGSPSRKVITHQPVLAEESEQEDDIELPARKVGRSKKSSEAAGSQARRVSQGQDDSGWEDNNIFQSGAESSSPARPSPARPKASRKSLGPRKSRKSLSAPPQLTPGSSPTKSEESHDLGRHLPSQLKFEPRLPPSVVAQGSRTMPKGKRASFVPVEYGNLVDEDDELNIVDRSADAIGFDTSIDRRLDEMEVAAEIEEDEEEDDNEDDGVEYNVAVSHRLAKGGQLVKRPRPPTTPESRSTPFFRLLLALFALGTSVGLVNYKMESAPLGYCDTGKNTNDALEKAKRDWNAVEACNRENRTLLYLQSLSGTLENPECPPPPLVPLPHPQRCTPCPEHGSCTQNTVTCDTGYLLRPHPVLFFLTPLSSTASSLELSPSLSPSELVWKLVSGATDGLPGFGPVAFPPRCLEDPKRKRNIGVLGKAIEAILGQERGRRVCAGDQKNDVKEIEGGEAKKWGMELAGLKETMKSKTAPHLLATFDDTFNEAVQQLVHWGGVIIGEDSKGNRYLAHKTPNLTWNCVITVKSRDIWSEWRATVLGIITTIAMYYTSKHWRARSAIENRRVAELVQIALDTLRNQELAHHTDPITAPQPYLSSLQLRDVILQDEHSISERRKLWDKVERVVEGNANVRTNLEEMHGGDEMRVWRWVGGSGLRKRVQFEERG